MPRDAKGAAKTHAAKEPKQTDIEDGTLRAAGTDPASNGYKPELVLNYRDKIGQEQRIIDEIMAAAKADCASHRLEIAKLKKAAGDAGLPAKPFATLLRRDRLAARLDTIDSELDDDAKGQYHQLCKAAGLIEEEPAPGNGADDGEAEDQPADEAAAA